MKTKIQIKLLVDKKQNRVMFTESDASFVDILLSFLTLPIATIVRLLDSKSTVGSIDNLYQSVATLDPKLLKTDECSKILTHPRSAYENYFRSQNLKVAIDEKRTTFYICSGRCENGLVSTSFTQLCTCGEPMRTGISLQESVGGYVKGLCKYIVTDDLQVKPVTTSSAAFGLIKEIGFGESNSFEEQTLNIGAFEVLLLLERALLSNGPLTEVLLGNQEATKNSCSKPGAYPEKTCQKRKRVSPETQDTSEQPNSSKIISLKLMVCRSSKKILYAEAGADFVDFLFSFLTFPLGSIIKLLSEKSSVGCIDNLYKSVKDISFDKSEMSEMCRKIFLDPKLPQHFKCSSQLLNIEEEGPLLGCNLKARYSQKLYSGVSNHECKETHVFLNAVNPKLDSLQTTSGGGFVNDEIIYMVTDTLDVKPLSPINAMSILNVLNVTVHDVEEKVVLVQEKEGLKLLKASMTSKTVLNDVFTANEVLIIPKEDDVFTANEVIVPKEEQ